MENLNLSQEITQSYLSALHLSIDHFCANEAKINDFIKTDAFLSHNHNDNNRHVDKMDIYYSKINYIALLALEKMGIICPSTKQIDTFESLLFKLDTTIRKINKSSPYQCYPIAAA